MTTAVYSYWVGAKVATGATDDAAWVIVIVLLVLISELIGWAVSVAMRRRRRLKKGDQGLPLLSPGAWGKPDLAPPSTSPEALAEVAELEALWRQPVGRRRRPASSD
jgi:hypothetical protein